MKKLKTNFFSWDSLNKKKLPFVKKKNSHRYHFLDSFSHLTSISLGFYDILRKICWLIKLCVCVSYNSKIDKKMEMNWTLVEWVMAILLDVCGDMSFDISFYVHSMRLKWDGLLVRLCFILWRKKLIFLRDNSIEAGGLE